MHWRPSPAALLLAAGWAAVAGYPGIALASGSVVIETTVHAAAGTERREACFEVDAIAVTGLEHVAPDTIRHRIAPLAPRCIGNEDVAALITAINEAHAEKGYLTTQAYLPQQDIRGSRRLTIEVVTGRIDTIEHRDTPQEAQGTYFERLGASWGRIGASETPWQFVGAVSGVLDTIDDPLDRFRLIDGATTWTAFSVEAGEPFQVDRLQQGLDQINRAPSARAKARLEPGSTPATSKVIVENPSEDSFRLWAGYDVNGSEEAGRERLRIDIAKDNLIGINDVWRASLAGGTTTNELAAHVSAPFRRATFALDGDYTESLLSLSPFAELLTRRGSVTPSLNYMLYRDRRHQVTAGAAFTWRGEDRFVNGLPLTPQRFAILRGQVGHTYFMDTMVLSTGAGISQGLTVLDATRDPEDADGTTPRAQFTRLDASASLAKVFPKLATLRLDATGYWTEHPLYAQDQLTLGSIGTVRGFKQAPFNADRGVLLRSELALSPQGMAERLSGADLTGAAATALSTLEPYLFSDAGYGEDIANSRHDALVGAGLGLRFRHNRLSMDVSAAFPVFRRDDVDLKNVPEIYFNLNLKLF